VQGHRGAAASPIDLATSALQQFIARVVAGGIGSKQRPGAVAVVISSHLSIIELLAQHATADLSSSCPLRLALHYRIFPAIISIAAAAADKGLSCILRRDVHGRTLLHVAAASALSRRSRSLSA
jgi:hypothetical protein